MNNFSLDKSYKNNVEFLELKHKNRQNFEILRQKRQRETETDNNNVNKQSIDLVFNKDHMDKIRKVIIVL